MRQFEGSTACPRWVAQRLHSWHRFLWRATHRAPHARRQGKYRVMSQNSAQGTAGGELRRTVV